MQKNISLEMNKKILIGSGRMDENIGIFFAKQLEWVNSQVFQIKYPMLKARELFPVNNQANPGAQTVTYNQYDQYGVAKIISDFASDLPRVDVKGEQVSAEVRTLGDSYGWNLNEIRAARMAGVNVETMKANAARRAILALENLIAFKGDSNYNLQGLLNHPNIPSADVPADGQGNTTEWVNKTADQIIRDVSDAVNQVIDLTKGVHTPTDILLPIAQYTLIATKRIPDTNITILKFILESNPFIRSITWVNELKDPFGDGVDYMVAYQKDPEILELNIPSDFESLPVEPSGLEFIVNCQERIAGMIIRYPLAISFSTGI
jgi:hypothetical protein